MEADQEYLDPVAVVVFLLHRLGDVVSERWTSWSSRVSLRRDVRIVCLCVMRPSHAAQRYNDLTDVIPKHLILVGRLDVQRNSGRFTWEIRGCTESATGRTSFLLPVLCAETSVLTAWYVVLPTHRILSCVYRELTGRENLG